MLFPISLDHYDRRIGGCSGLALKHGLNVRTGVVDPDFRGKVCVVLFNQSKNSYEVNVGDHVAQTVLEKYETMKFDQLTDNEESPKSERCLNFKK